MSAEETLRVSLQKGKYRLVDKQGAIQDANRFLEALDIRGLSSLTIRAYAYDLLAFYRWMRRRKLGIEELTQAKLLDFVRAQKQGGAHPNSINRRLVVCRLLYRFCTDEELATGRGASLPAPYYKGPGRDHDLGLHMKRSQRERLLQLKAPRKLIEPLTAEEVRLFLRRLRRYRDLSIVYLMLLCGLRSREVLSIEMEDVSFYENRLRVRGKGSKERALPLPHLILQSLTQYLKWERPTQLPHMRLFVVLQGARRGEPMSPAGLRSLFRWRRTEQAISRANPHRFRHTFGTDMARQGIRLPILQAMMGHDDSAMTLQYINLSMNDIADEYQRAIKQIQKRYHNT